MACDLFYGVRGVGGDLRLKLRIYDETDFLPAGLRMRAMPPRIRQKARIKGQVIFSLRKNMEKAVAQKALK